MGTGEFNDVSVEVRTQNRYSPLLWRGGGGEAEAASKTYRHSVGCGTGKNSESTAHTITQQKKHIGTQCRIKYRHRSPRRKPAAAHFVFHSAGNRENKRYNGVFAAALIRSEFNRKHRIAASQRSGNGRRSSVLFPVCVIGVESSAGNDGRQSRNRCPESLHTAV